MQRKYLRKNIYTKAIKTCFAFASSYWGIDRIKLTRLLAEFNFRKLFEVGHNKKPITSCKINNIPIKRLDYDTYLSIISSKNYNLLIKDRQFGELAVACKDCYVNVTLDLVNGDDDINIRTVSVNGLFERIDTVTDYFAKTYGITLIFSRATINTIEIAYTVATSDKIPFTVRQLIIQSITNNHNITLKEHFKDDYGDDYAKMIASVYRDKNCTVTFYDKTQKSIRKEETSDPLTGNDTRRIYRLELCLTNSKEIKKHLLTNQLHAITDNLILAFINSTLDKTVSQYIAIHTAGIRTAKALRRKVLHTPSDNQAKDIINLLLTAQERDTYKGVIDLENFYMTTPVDDKDENFSRSLKRLYAAALSSTNSTETYSRNLLLRFDGWETERLFVNMLQAAKTATIYGLGCDFGLISDDNIIKTHYIAFGYYDSNDYTDGYHNFLTFLRTNKFFFFPHDPTDNPNKQDRKNTKIRKYELSSDFLIRERMALWDKGTLSLADLPDILKKNAPQKTKKITKISTY